MKDPLERFITENKAEFDVFEPDERIWEKIDQKLDRPAGSGGLLRKMAPWKVAAAILMMAGVSWIFILLNRPAASVDSNRPDLYASQIMEAEDYYGSQIKANKVRLMEYKAEGVSLDDDILAETDALEKMYRELRQELKSAANDGLVLEAMVQNLQMQVEILNRQLQLLEHIKALKDGKQENESQS
jgi:hypothetical protein